MSDIITFYSENNKNQVRLLLYFKKRLINHRSPTDHTLSFKMTHAEAEKMRDALDVTIKNRQTILKRSKRGKLE